jgi:hypothetical protein
MAVLTHKQADADHRLLALWAAQCAEHVLEHFAQKYPNDDRPCRAIDAARAWASGKIRCGVARTAALAAHAAARDAQDPAARAAARAAAHAAATAHMAGHARHAAAYAALAVAATAAATERKWQTTRVPRRLWPAAFDGRSKKQEARNKK